MPGGADGNVSLNNRYRLSDSGERRKRYFTSVKRWHKTRLGRLAAVEPSV